MATKTTPKQSKSAGSKSAFSERICNLVPSRDVQKDWQFSHAAQAGLVAAPAAIPTSVDLRAPWWAVNDQGSTGSCVGWATADGVLRYHLVKANRLHQSKMISPRFVWMASKETDEFMSRPESFMERSGTSLKNAMDVIRKHGCVLESELPFTINTLMYSGEENSFYASASTRKAASYFNLAKDTNHWKTWLATKGPILAGLGVDATWRNAKATAGNLDAFKPATVDGGHAVCIVGYTTTRFIIRNSWGTTWGDQGFGYASVPYINAGFFGESYGISL